MEEEEEDKWDDGVEAFFSNLHPPKMVQKKGKLRKKTSIRKTPNKESPWKPRSPERILERVETICRLTATDKHY